MSFTNEKRVKATRKRHLCSACDKWIEVGEPAINWAGMTDGDFSSAHFHPDCREAEVAFNRLHDTCWHDEWQGLGDFEQEDRLWLKTEWPISYLRLCMTRDQYATHLTTEQPR